MRQTQYRCFIQAFLVANLVALIALAPALGQSTSATLTGTVTDASGAIIPGASITLTNEASGDVRNTVTNSAGYYSISPIPPGTYALTVEASGFQRQRQTGVVLNSAEIRNLNSTLQVGSTAETVEVTASAEQLTLTSGERATVLTTQTLQTIGQVGRSAAEYLKLMPGMIQTANTVQNSPAFSGETMGINGTGNAGRQSALGTFSAYGTPTASMEIMSDGAHVSDPGCNCATPVNPNGDMVQEVKVMTSAFSAENSKGPVVISTITKSGGSYYHGTAYMSLRNFRFNANDWLNNRNGSPNPHNEYYFPGGNIGGPVLIPGTGFNKNRDKLFFFAGFEYFYQSLTSSPVLTSVPTEAMRAGNFSQASIDALGPAGKVPGNPKPLSGPLFPNGQIPAGMIDKGGKVMMGLLPMPNADPAQTGGFNYVKQVLWNQNGYQFVTRLDYNISSTTKLSGRYYHQQELQPFPISLWGGGAPGVAGNTNRVPYPSRVLGHNHSESLAGNLTQVFSPTLTNEIIAAASYVNFPNSFEDPSAIDPVKLGYPYHGIFNNGTPQIPNISGANNQVANLSNNGGFWVEGGTLSAKKPAFSIADNVAWAWRTHTFKAGFYGEYYANIQPTYSEVNGTITVDASSPTSSGNAYADLLMGRVSAFTQANKNVIQAAASYLWEGYVQDSWKITRRFNIDYGIRFQHDRQWFDRNNIGYAVWNPSTYVDSPTAVLPGIAWNAIDPSVPNAGYPDRALFYAPRFGMAWDTFGTGKFLVRGGIGTYRYRGMVSNTGIQTANGSYVQGLTTSTGTTLAAIDATPAPPRITYGSSQTLVNRNDDQMPLSYTYNLTVSYTLPQSTRLEVAYVGTKARHLPIGGTGTTDKMHNINAVPYGTMLSVPNPNSVNYNLYRPYKSYADVTIQTYDAFSDYHGMQLTLNHQSNRYMYLLNYTYSKVTGQGAGTVLNVLDTLNPANNHGPLSFDRRNSFNVAYSVQVPNAIQGGGNKILSGIMNGWSVTGTVQYLTGAPLQLNSSNSRFGMTLPKGVTNLNITGTNSVPAMPVLTCDPRTGLGDHQYLNPNCFALPTPGNNGPIIEPEAFGPGFLNADLGIYKDFKFTESKRLQLRAQGFNFMNHPNYSFGNDNNLNLVFDAAGKQTNTLFGTTTSKLGHRVVRLEAKFYF